MTKHAACKYRHTQRIRRVTDGWAAMTSHQHASECNQVLVHNVELPICIKEAINSIGSTAAAIGAVI